MKAVDSELSQEKKPSLGRTRWHWPARLRRTDSFGSLVVSGEQKNKHRATILSKVVATLGSVVSAKPAMGNADDSHCRCSGKDALQEDQKPRLETLADSSKEGLNYGWRERARCHANYVTVANKGKNSEELSMGVKMVLDDSTFHGRPESGRKYWEGFLPKVRRVNSIGAPRVRVVWWRTLHELGRLPRWPDDQEHILDLEELITVWNNKCDKDGGCDGHYMYVRFLSHRWERPHYCEQCVKGTCHAKAHPDTESNIKARVIGAFGHDRYYDLLDTRPFHPEDAYFWIDFAGINQDDVKEKMAGIAILPLYVSCCANGMVVYVGHDGTYADRAWTALERVLAYGMTASPVIMKLDQGYEEGVAEQDRNALSMVEPEYWSLKGDVLHLRLRDPAEGQITVKHDLEHIRKIAELAAQYPPIDFFGAKDKHLKFGLTEIPVEELSRVSHHLTKRKYNDRTVCYRHSGEFESCHSNESGSSVVNPGCCGLFRIFADRRKSEFYTCNAADSSKIPSLFSLETARRTQQDIVCRRKFFVSPTVLQNQESCCNNETVLQTSEQVDEETSSQSVALACEAPSALTDCTSSAPGGCAFVEPLATLRGAQQDPLRSLAAHDDHVERSLDHAKTGAHTEVQAISAVVKPTSTLQVPEHRFLPGSRRNSNRGSKRGSPRNGCQRTRSSPETPEAINRPLAASRRKGNSGMTSCDLAMGAVRSDALLENEPVPVFQRKGTGPVNIGEAAMGAVRSNALLENDPAPVFASPTNSPRGDKHLPRRRKVCAPPNRN